MICTSRTEQRLLCIIARQLADGLDAPGWAERKLSAVQAVRRASQAGVDELGKAVALDVFDAVAEAYNTGCQLPVLLQHRQVHELGCGSSIGRLRRLCGLR
ncbi:hypothetical protein [Streptomyces sp. NPDC058297]|uniref:hypothetical protein n=1 Tax=Streptomyces sp. NPDC058297 TaxID=3346433 RepID=UPI0036EFC8F9